MKKNQQNCIWHIEQIYKTSSILSLCFCHKWRADIWELIHRKYDRWHIIVFTLAPSNINIQLIYYCSHIHIVRPAGCSIFSAAIFLQDDSHPFSLVLWIFVLFSQPAVIHSLYTSLLYLPEVINIHSFINWVYVKVNAYFFNVSLIP